MDTEVVKYIQRFATVLYEKSKRVYDWIQNSMDLTHSARRQWQIAASQISKINIVDA